MDFYELLVNASRSFPDYGGYGPNSPSTDHLRNSVTHYSKQDQNYDSAAALAQDGQRLQKEDSFIVKPVGVKIRRKELLQTGNICDLYEIDELSQNLEEAERSPERWLCNRSGENKPSFCLLAFEVEQAELFKKLETSKQQVLHEVRSAGIKNAGAK